MRLAIVHDYLNQYGGAERVVEAMHRAFPEAPVFTTICDRDRMPASFAAMDVRTSFLQKAPGIFRFFRGYLPLYRRAIESLDLSGHDVVLSSSSAFAKGAHIPTGARHVCYCHNPMRFAHDASHYFESERGGRVGRALLSPYLRRLARWDIANSSAVDRFVANSRTVANRVQRLYGREASIVHPPVPVTRWRDLAASRSSHAALDAALGADGFPRRGFYLVVSRLRAYKRVDLAVDACIDVQEPLLVIGDGAERGRLAARAGRTVRFLGRQTDAVIAAAYARCKAFLFPGEEDFGITPVEAMACGAPVIAYAAGGALETVEGPTVSPGATLPRRAQNHRWTGVFFTPQTPETLAAAMTAAASVRFSPNVARKSAARFDENVFARKLRAELARV